MTIYGQKITYNRTLDEYSIVASTPSYMTDLNFYSNQINSSRIEIMSKKLSNLEKIINSQQ